MACRALQRRSDMGVIHAWLLLLIIVLAIGRVKSIKVTLK